MLEPLDYVVLVVYCVGVVAFGLYASGKQKSAADYFLGGRDLPWWAVCFSIVATETSTLTVIGVPAVAYGGSMTFLQLTIGYVVGRVVVAAVFIPRYYAGELQTAYAFLGDRYGNVMRGTASATFLVTRLLADGVRLFATAIPLKVVASMAGFEVTFAEIILLIGVVTVLYTYVGGIRAVVWMDVVQMLVYLGGAAIAIGILLAEAEPGWYTAAAQAGKTAIWDGSGFRSFAELVVRPYTFPTAVLGGAIFSMASHGTDQIIVQRLLACRDQRSSQTALIVSGFVVAFQFALFLFVGLLLWSYYGGVAPSELGLDRGDEVFPLYIIQRMPTGLAGLLIAGILAAAMSTLSSSLNALASSTMLDLWDRIRPGQTETGKLRLARFFTLCWGLVFVVFANLFTDRDNPVVELGLAIASFTYGGLLGAFLLGLFNRQSRQIDAVISFIATIFVMIIIIKGAWWGPEGWLLDLQTPEDVLAGQGYRRVAWPWYTAIGAAINLALGSVLALRHGLNPSS